MFIVGVMGAGDATAEDIAMADELGQLIAENGWVTLNGGRSAGVMDAVNQGAKKSGGLTVGILPDKKTGDSLDVSSMVDIVIQTGMGSARNVINVLSSDVVIACGVPGNGTISEISLALKENRPVILLRSSEAATQLFEENTLVTVVNSSQEAIEVCKEISN